MRPSLDMRCPCRRAQVVRLTSRKVDVGRSQRENLMGPLTNSHARARMRCAQDRSSPRLLDASSAERNVVDASLLTSFWLMSRTRSVWSCAMVRAGTRARRAHRRLRRNEARLVPARETSGREVRFLSTNGRGGADRARPSPFLCQTVARTRRVLVKWKILEGNSAASVKKMHGIKPRTQDPSRKMQGFLSYLIVSPLEQSGAK